MAKVKAKQNKASNVETRQISDMSSEELGLLLNQQYQQFMNIQTNIREINLELSKRKQNG